MQSRFSKVGKNKPAAATFKTHQVFDVATNKASFEYWNGINVVGGEGCAIRPPVGWWLNCDDIKTRICFSLLRYCGVVN
jgi:hypothetical protein